MSGAPWQWDGNMNGEGKEMEGCRVPVLDLATEPKTGLLRAHPLSFVWGWGSGLEFKAVSGDPNPSS